MVALVATARTRRKDEVSPGNSHDERVEKKNALRPNAARGKAVAAPLFLGQFKAATRPLGPMPSRIEGRLTSFQGGIERAAASCIQLALDRVSAN